MDERERHDGDESKGLLDPRSEGPLALPRTLALPYIRLQLRERFPKDRKYVVEPSPTLSLEAVTTLEEFLQTRLADEVLAFFATKARALADFSLSKVGGLTEHAWDLGMPKGRIALGLVEGRYMCMPRRFEPGHPVRVTFYDPDARVESDALTLAAWVDRLEQRADTEIDFDALDRLDNRAAKQEWCPVLVSTPAVQCTQEPERRVRHPKFGEGIVRKSHERGEKLEIEFAEGTKVLLAKFVQELA
jgi:hypothetical protein